jgi:hypothetical protein
VETIVEAHEEWVLVRKNPDVREQVEATDPRN